MRRGLDSSVRHDARDDRMRALARGAAGAIGHGDEMRLQRRKTIDRLPELDFHFRRLRRKEFVGDVEIGRAAEDRLFARSKHQAVS